MLFLQQAIRTSGRPCVREEPVGQRAVCLNAVYLTLSIVVRVRAIILRVKPLCTCSWINLPAPCPARSFYARMIYGIRRIYSWQCPSITSHKFLFARACFVASRGRYNHRGTELAAISSLSISLARQRAESARSPSKLYLNCWNVTIRSGMIVLPGMNRHIYCFRWSPLRFNYERKPNNFPRAF